MKFYTGIGSRETPLMALARIEELAFALAASSYVLRSGCAPGADSAFEKGALDALWLELTNVYPELYLPWRGFEGRPDHMVTRVTPQEEAYAIAAKFHPAWGRLSRGGRALHARNVHEILGFDVTAPVLSSYVICWTKDGKGAGGTGQALRIAKHYEVKILDLGLTIRA